MILKSEITGKEYVVNTYISESFGGCRIDHNSFQDILENQLGPDVSYDIEVLAATSTYCAAKCTIKDTSGRKVQGFNDVNTKFTGNRERKDFTVEHPLLAAVNAAVDSAVRAYLKWEKIYPDDSLDIPESTEDNSDVSGNPDELDASIFSGMNPPEDEESETKKAECVDETGKNEKSDEDKATLRKRLKELGAMYPPKGTKYDDMTLDEIWKKQQQWIIYVQKNKAEKYAYVHEYYDLKQKQKKGEL